MKTFPVLRLTSYLMVFFALFLTSCNDDDSDMPDTMEPPVDNVTVTNTMTYDLGSLAVPEISGKRRV